MFVVPKQGYKIPDPSLSDFLPEQGREVQRVLIGFAVYGMVML
jgi:hypothetical protein